MLHLLLQVQRVIQVIIKLHEIWNDERLTLILKFSVKTFACKHSKHWEMCLYIESHTNTNSAMI